MVRGEGEGKRLESSFFYWFSGVRAGSGVVVGGGVWCGWWGVGRGGVLVGGVLVVIG